jgi:hypothetical protein
MDLEKSVDNSKVGTAGMERVYREAQIPEKIDWATATMHRKAILPETKQRLDPMFISSA